MGREKVFQQLMFLFLKLIKLKEGENLTLNFADSGKYEIRCISEYKGELEEEIDIDEKIKELEKRFKL